MRNSKKLLVATLGAALLAWSGLAAATPVVVDAYANSFGGGTAKDSGIYLELGQQFSVSVDPNAIWHFTSDPVTFPWTYTNADGSDGVYPIVYPDHTRFLGAHYGELIAQIGTGTASAGKFFAVGTKFNGQANASGVLNFFFHDSDQYGNGGQVTANVSVNAVPEPASLALAGLALGALAFTRRRKV